MNRVFHERLDGLEVKLLDTGALRTEEATNMAPISNFVPPNLETSLGSVQAVPQVIQSSSEQEQRSALLDRLGEAPAIRTIHPRQRSGSVIQASKTTSGTSRSETTTTATRREQRRLLMWSRYRPLAHLQARCYKIQPSDSRTSS